jgi:shikimate dehydrogenase
VEHAAVLGAGGTAVAAATALASLGARLVDVVVREPARAADLLRVLDVLGVQADVQRLDRTGALSAPVVVSTVPVAGQPAVADLAWWPGQTVLDVLYAGWPTPLARRVQQAGGTTISGLEVLLWQATAQVELMTGQPAPIDAMRAALGG